jgi:hypothetical protein
VARRKGARNSYAQDPLNGEVLLSWRGRWLWGAVDDPSPQRQTLVEELGRKLAAQ